MPFPLFRCQTPKVWLIFSFTPLSTFPTSPSLSSFWAPPTPSHPCLSPHHCRKALLRIPRWLRQNHWSVFLLFGLLAISGTVGDSTYLESFFFDWSSWDVAWFLPPFYHSLVSFAGPSSSSLPVGIPKTLVSFPDWFHSIMYSFTLKTSLSPCTRLGTLLNTEITVVFSKHSDFNGLPMLYSTLSLYMKSF